MSEFDEIRPYNDDEVATALARLVDEPNIISAVARFIAPLPNRWLPGLVQCWVARVLKTQASRIHTVEEFQQFLANYFARMIRDTTDGFSFDGLDKLDPKQSYLFVSNHRDIAMDSGFMNWALHQSGFPTSRIAIGDNLLTKDYATDLMRLNKSFVVKRGESGRAAYAALLECSRYIRHSIEEGVSVWIAQRPGRAKDGIDRTEPAIIKMFALAFRKEAEDFGEIVERLGVVPVSISYELDPCDVFKARELAAQAEERDYEKPPDEDLQSVIAGITGHKGRVHVHFGEPLRGEYTDADAVAADIDRQIVSGSKIFPTHEYAAARLANGGSVQSLSAPVRRSWLPRLKQCPPGQRKFVLMQYANILKNREELGIS
jgi:hypothetical protein